MENYNKCRKFFATTATAALVASAIVPVSAAAAFNDEDQISSWAKEAVAFLAEKGAVVGDDKGNFNPANYITRAEASRMVSIALNLDREGTNDFPDVPTDVWYSKYVTALVNAGICCGDDQGNFLPKGELTRAEAAKFIVRAYDLEGSADLSKFEDASQIQSWSNKYIEAAVANGVLKGDNGKIRPNDPTTREEFAVMFKLAYDAAQDPADTVAPEIVSVNTEGENKVVVKFNEAVTSVQNGALLLVGGKEVKTNGSPVISEDKKVVTYTFDTSALEFKDGKLTATLRLPAGEATDESGNKTKEHKEDVTFVKAPAVPGDIVAPKFVSASVTDASTILVKYDEELSGTPIVKVNGEDPAKVVVEGDTVKITPKTPLKAGETAEIMVTNVTDVAGNVAKPVIMNVTAPAAPEDTVAPKYVSATVTDASTILVKFNEELSGTPNVTVEGKEVATVVVEGDTVKVTLKTPLTAGEAAKMIVRNVTDVAGNVAKPVLIKVKAPAAPEDTVAPKFVSATVTDTSTILVKYDEELSGTPIVKVNGEDPAKVVVEGDTVKITPKTPLKAGETAEIMVTNVTDVAGNVAKPVIMNVTAPAAPEDTVAPKFVSATVTQDEASTILVKYDEELSGTPIVKVNGEDPAKVVVEGDTVKITPKTPLKAGETAEIMVTNVTDVAGNVAKPVIMNVTAPAAPDDTVAPKFVSATVTEDEASTILVKFNEELSGTPSVTVEGKEVTKVVVEGDTVKVTLKTPLKAGETAEIVLTGVTDVAGNVAEPVRTTVKAPDDTVAPKVVSVKTVDENKVVVTYDEAVTSVQDGAYLSVAGNKVATASGSEISEDGKVVTYTFDTSALEFVDGQSTAVLNLPEGEATDEFGNETKEHTDSVTFVANDTVAPEIVSVNTVGENKVAVTFNEAISSVKAGAYLSVGDNEVATATSSVISEDKKVVTYTFDTSGLEFKDGKLKATLHLPAGEAIDAFGNKTKEHTAAVTFVKADTGAPTVIDSYYKDDAFVFEFSEAVTLVTEHQKRKITYQRIDPATGNAVGPAIELTPENANFKLSKDGKKLTVELKNGELRDGTYKVSFDAGMVVDKEKNPIEAYTTTIRVDDDDRTASIINVIDSTPDDATTVTTATVAEGNVGKYVLTQDATAALKAATTVKI